MPTSLTPSSGAHTLTAQRHSYKKATISSLPLSLKALSKRDTCGGLSDYSACDVDWCIPEDATCCNFLDGSYCDSGNYCVDGGCCENGKTCTGVANSCDVDAQECGGACIPKDAVCCNKGTLYCDAGQTCDGVFCRSRSDDDEDDDDDIGKSNSKNSSDTDDDDDDDNAAGRFAAPTLMAGLIAAIPIIL
ncbi:hypothetical protein GMORB2_2468 [Geosmithia morbida]|uniref:Anaphylatoxin-like domain-containing protein n=1 Tax=Geosmithia morbida TaxID=1094350 RepID=A0A9P4YSF2_9HYPO|nr:uncharacterized protein GMORB2_2468 [Geosmithia morbida]KAF4120982.1 hypothetical protein GMORB2_2468 [Geosmithia morbida]